MDVLVSRDERRRHGRRSRVVLTPRRWCQACEMMISRVTGARKPGPRRERAISRNTIAQGRPVDWLNLVVAAASFFYAGGPWVRPVTRPSLRPLIREGHA
jgi:hypothetical protein